MKFKGFNDLNGPRNPLLYSHTSTNSSSYVGSLIFDSLDILVGFRSISCNEELCRPLCGIRRRGSCEKISIKYSCLNIRLLEVQ